MYKLKKIKISGFRRLLAVDLEIRPFMVLIGANGVGKTSFLDALGFLSASASGALNNTLSQFGGISNILTRGKAEELSFFVEVDVPRHSPLEYDLSLTTKGIGYAISKETLMQRKLSELYRYIDSSDGNIRYAQPSSMLGWGHHNAQETSLAQAPNMMFQEPEELKKILSTATQYHILDVGPRAPIKLPQQLMPATLPGVEGETLVPYLYNLRECNKDIFDMLLDSLRAAFSDFEDLSFPPVAAGMLAMTWKDAKFNRPLYAHELSEGTLRFLWLASLLQSPNLPAITMIDEPEVSLHPELLNILSELMREASKRTHLIVATHSDRLVRFLKPEEVVVMDMDEEGCASATWADTMDLDEWLTEYSLDEVWQMGRMGGRS